MAVLRRCCPLALHVSPPPTAHSAPRGQKCTVVACVREELARPAARNKAAGAQIDPPSKRLRNWRGDKRPIQRASHDRRSPSTSTTFWRGISSGCAPTRSIRSLISETSGRRHVHGRHTESGQHVSIHAALRLEAATSTRFNPRRPRGRRQNILLSSHRDYFVSIHAAREGGDPAANSFRPLPIMFQSTPPARGRRRVSWRMS